jgi:Ca-activated chloride channel family protein
VSCRVALVVVVVLFVALLVAPASLHAQSGRNRPEPQPSPSPGAQQRPRRATPARTTEDAPPGEPSTPSAPSRVGDSRTQNGASQTPAAGNKSQQNSPTEIDDEEVYKVESNLVPVSANVMDSTGHPITDLKLEDFELRVDGQPKPISDLSHAETPVRIALLFDNSSSIRPTRELEKQAAINFFRTVIRPIDQAAIFSISTVPTLDQSLTNDVSRLVRTIERYGEVEGSTALFDTIVMAADYLRTQPGRKVMIIVSDGVETTSNLTDFGEMVRRVLASDCQVFAIQTGLSQNANIRDLTAERRMQDLTSYTGGFVNVPKLPSDLELAFTQIAADLSQQYVLSYYPNDDARDGRFRVITLRVKSRPNVRVRARRGYYPRRSENLSSLTQSYSDAAVPNVIRDPVVTSTQTTQTRDAAPNVVASNTVAPGARAPVPASAQTHGSKNLDPDADDLAASDGANTKPRPTVRLGTFDPVQSATAEQPAPSAHDSPPPKTDAQPAPADTKPQPTTQTSRPDSNQTNANPAASSTTTNTSAPPAAAPADEANAKDSQQSAQPARSETTSQPASSQPSSSPPTSPPQTSSAKNSSPQNSPAKNPSPQNSSPSSSQQGASSQSARASSPAGETQQKPVVAGGVLNSRAKSLPVPTYPEAARRMRVVGMVAVEVMVDESGKVIEARALSGPALLREAAVGAARQARFPQTLVSGQPARLTGVINYNFTF